MPELRGQEAMLTQENGALNRVHPPAPMSEAIPLSEVIAIAGQCIATVVTISNDQKFRYHESFCKFIYIQFHARP